MIAGLLLALAITVGIAGAIWPWTSLYDHRGSVRLLATLVLSSSVVVLLQLALSGFASLSPAPLRVLAIATAVVIAGAWGARAAMLPAAAAARSNEAAAPLATGLGLGLGALVALAYVAVAAAALLVAPYGWDSLTYHLTDILHAAATRSLARFPYPARNLYYPQVGELHSLWCFLLGGAGPQAWRTVGFGLMPLGLTAGVATRVAVEALGFSAAARWAAPVVMLAPVVLIQPLAGYVDVAFAAFVLASFAFAVLAAQHGRFADIAFCALAAGLGLGVKISFLYFCAPVLLVLLDARAWGALGRTPRQVAARLGICAALLLAGCGYWLGRNLLDTGNPLYPVNVQVAGVTILDGPKETERSKLQERWFVPRTLAWARYPFLETMDGAPRYSLENGFGAPFAAGCVALLVMLPLAAQRRQWLHVRVLLALPVTVFLWLRINPYQEPRYVIAGCGFAFVALAALAAEVEETAGGTRLPLLVLQGALGIAIVFGALGGVASAAPLLPEVVREWKAGEWTPQSYLTRIYGSAARGFNWIADNSPDGRTVAFTNPTFLAPLFGWQGRNRVVYLPVAGDPPIGRFAPVSSYRAWRRALRESGAEWVVRWVPWWPGATPTRTEQWIDQDPAGFQLLRNFERARIYRPVFSPEEEVALRALGRGVDVSALGNAAAWKVEHLEHAQASVQAAPEGGLFIDYSFSTADNDYADLWAPVEAGDWSEVGRLQVDMVDDLRATYLFVYLKAADPRKAARYRIDTRKVFRDAAPGERRTVTVDLLVPDRRTPGFELSDTATVHLVVDDAEDAVVQSGRLWLGNFRLAGPVEDSAAAPVPEGNTP